MNYYAIQILDPPIWKIDLKLDQRIPWFNFIRITFPRRGIHCWVCDSSARKLSGQARSAVAEYLQLVSGGDQVSKKVNLKGESGVHPSVERAVDFIKGEFTQLCLQDQDILGKKKIKKGDIWKSDNDRKNK